MTGVEFNWMDLLSAVLGAVVCYFTTGEKRNLLNTALELFKKNKGKR